MNVSIFEKDRPVLQQSLLKGLTSRLDPHSGRVSCQGKSISRVGGSLSIFGLSRSRGNVEDHARESRLTPSYLRICLETVDESNRVKRYLFLEVPGCITSFEWAIRL
jgi:hypothetical protein